MSARQIPDALLNKVAESDALFIENARMAVASYKHGKLTPIQLNSLLEWQKLRAWERYERRLHAKHSSAVKRFIFTQKTRPTDSRYARFPSR